MLVAQTGFELWRNRLSWPASVEQEKGGPDGPPLIWLACRSWLKASSKLSYNQKLCTGKEIGGVS